MEADVAELKVSLHKTTHKERVFPPADYTSDTHLSRSLRSSFFSSSSSISDSLSLLI